MAEKSGADSRYRVVILEVQPPVSNDVAEEVESGVPLQTSLDVHCLKMYLGGIESSSSYFCDPIPVMYL